MNDLFAPPIVSLAAVRREEAQCRRCGLYRDATQVVPGEGKLGAVLMLVGEQPGDREDLAGKPFIGPAGHILDRALAEADIPRGKVFVTNAVKHFKYEPRGKRRLHKRPDAGEIEACRWWLDIERQLVRPSVILAMGATAARGVLGHAVTIAKTRDQTQTLGDGTKARVTIHPSLLLRLRTDAEKAVEYGRFVGDLQAAAALAGLSA
ncbi:MAG TPA: UdgX family uracil-DNA binding protein [Stellaceae bacterium]|nr:UdgX family uracil-DNA binding protein [Stellaceae bacterium]